MLIQWVTLVGLALILTLMLLPAIARVFGGYNMARLDAATIKSVMQRCRPLIHLMGLVFASAMISAVICYTTLLWLWVFILGMLRVPIGVQTGPDYVPHPVFDHPAFLLLSILGVVSFLAVIGYLTLRRPTITRLMVAIAFFAIVLAFSILVIPLFEYPLTWPGRG